MWLDCHDVDTALGSITAAIGVARSDLERVLRDYEEASFEDHSEDPWKQMPRDVLAGFCADLEAVASSFAGAYYFHGTRVVEPESFRRRGILPLDQMVEELWAVLREMVGNEITDENWAAFKRSVERDAGADDGFLYRLKTGGRIHFGPFALLVRETLLAPTETGSHDYLGCPEIVEDVARCFRRAHGTDLEQRFREASKPCIIRFSSTQLRPGAINAVLWYVYTKLRCDEITSSANWSFDGEGKPVPPESVVAVEIVCSSGHQPPAPRR